jgi:alpha-2-macroglobulin
LTASKLYRTGWRWYDHDTLRDERSEVYATLLPAGVYAYTYAAHARTPGTYVAGPARVEEMYHPETFGRTASEKVIVYQP